MNSEERLNYLGERYRSRGFNVVIHPKPEDLPAFAKDFKVEMVATKDDGSVLVAAKDSRSDFEADAEVARYAEIIDKHPGWQFDVYVLGPERQVKVDQGKAKEPPDEQIARDLNGVEQILQAGFVEQSLVAAWSALEAAMRKKLLSGGESVGWGTSPRTLLNELYSVGSLSTSLFRDLEKLYQSRSMIVHGFTAPSVEPRDVQLLVDTARRLLTDSQPVKQPA
jgi:hypothetical protein